MHGSGFVGELVEVFNAVANVVRVEDGVFGGLPQAVGTVGEDVRQRADEHAGVAVEGADPANRLRPIILPGELAV